MKILTGLFLVISLSPAFAAEPEGFTPIRVDQGSICVYESRFFSEGSVVGVQPENRIFIQCVREKVEIKGVEYSLLSWKMLGAPKQQ